MTYSLSIEFAGVEIIVTKKRKYESVISVFKIFVNLLRKERE